MTFDGSRHAAFKADALPDWSTHRCNVAIVTRRTYTLEQKTEALELLAAVGASEAARRTGVNRGTLVSWAHRAGVVSADPEGRRANVEVAHLAWAERRLILADMLGAAADDATKLLLQRIRRNDIGNAELVRAVAVLVDRAQLLSGGATGRVEHAPVERTPEFEAELAQVLEFRLREAS